MTTEQRLDNIDARLDRLVTLNEQALTRQDRTDEKLDRLVALQEQSIVQQSRLDEKLEALSDQVGRLTEGLTEIRLTAERQERNIDRLVGIVETLIQQR